MQCMRRSSGLEFNADHVIGKPTKWIGLSCNEFLEKYVQTVFEHSGLLSLDCSGASDTSHPMSSASLHQPSQLFHIDVQYSG